MGVVYCAFLCLFWFSFMKSFHGLSFHSTCNALFFAEKGPHYTAQAFFFGVPLALVTWMEALLCEQVIRPIGGHLVYDLMIPVSLLAFYAYVRMVAVPDKLKLA